MAGECKAEEVKREPGTFLGPDGLRQLEGPIPKSDAFVVRCELPLTQTLQLWVDSRQQFAKATSQPAKERHAGSMRQKPPAGL